MIKSLKVVEQLKMEIMNQKTTEIISEAVIVDHWTNPNDGNFYSLAYFELDKFKQKLDRVEELNSVWKWRDFAQKNEEKFFEQFASQKSITPPKAKAQSLSLLGTWAGKFGDRPFELVIERQ